MSNWQLVADELQRWSAAGLTPTLWWRDDDAQRDSAALRQLNDLSLEFALPLHLAVIPDGSDASLRALFAANPRLYALQHGYSHRNHAPADQRKCELGDQRPLAQVLDELQTGQQQLQQLLGAAFTPVLVPPWNRLSQALPPQLLSLGFVGLSTLGPRSEPRPYGLRQTNVHVDLIDWKQRRFAGETQVLTQLLAHLQDRRLERVDSREATGIMTHHLAHDQDCWRFCQDLFAFCRQQPLRWCAAPELFPTP